MAACGATFRLSRVAAGSQANDVPQQEQTQPRRQVSRGSPPRKMLGTSEVSTMDAVSGTPVNNPGCFERPVLAGLVFAS